jgi:hypothetical protein
LLPVPQPIFVAPCLPLPQQPLRRGRLLWLGAGVLVAHLALLQGMPASFGIPTPQDGPVRLLTRSIAAPAPALPTLAAAPATHVPAPARPARRAEPVFSAQKSTGAGVIAEHLAIKNDAPAAQDAPPAHAEAPPASSASAPLPAAASSAMAAASAPAPAAAAQRMAVSIAEPVRIQYQVKGQSRGLNYSAHAVLLWQPHGASYDARLEVSVFLLGSRVQTSSGSLTPQGLAPTRFSDKSKSEQAAHFERDKGRISFSGNQPDAALLPGAQDRLSVVLQLAALLAGDPARYPAGSRIAIQTAGPRDADVWEFVVAGEETVVLPGGEVAGIKLVRPPRREYDQKVELWFAPSHKYLPIRIKLTQVRGDFVDQLYESSETP